MLVIVLSPLGGSGKTTVALNTAAAGAAAGLKTLAIELDFSPGSFRSFFEIERGKNITAAVESCDVQGFVTKTPYGFDVIPVENCVRKPGPDAFRIFLQKALQKYELVVVDTSPVMDDLVYTILRDFGAIRFVVITGLRGTEGMKRVAEWLEGLMLQGLARGDEILILNQVIKKQVWIVKDIFRGYPIGANIPLTKEVPEKGVSDGVMRLLAKTLGFKLKKEKKGILEFFRRLFGM